jgi:hypothetical protein
MGCCINESVTHLLDQKTFSNQELTPQNYNIDRFFQGSESIQNIKLTSDFEAKKITCSQSDNSSCSIQSIKNRPIINRLIMKNQKYLSLSVYAQN